MREQDLKEKKYVEIVYDEMTQNWLRHYCMSHNLDLTVESSGGIQDPEDFEFHSTVFYSTSYHSAENTTYDINVSDVVPTHFSLFGEEQNILVIEVQSEQLNTIRHSFEIKGYQDEWPDYKPHITLCYDYRGDLPEFELPDFNMSADVLKIKRQS